MAIDYNKTPYYDDFSETKKFLKILFRPGRAVQARELTQLQTILQNQISRGGTHIFKNGSRVFGGEQVYDRNIRYLAIQSINVDGTTINVKNFSGKVIRNTTNTIYAKVRDVVEKENNDPATLFIVYEQATSGGDGEFTAGEEIFTYDETGVDTSVYSAVVYPLAAAGATWNGKTVAAADTAVHTGPCALYEVDAGVYYYRGEYVLADKQAIVLSKYSSNTTYRIGYKVAEDTVTSSDDSSLYDPASGFSNFTAPGADRRRVTLTLTKVGNGEYIEETAQDNFFEIARIDEGRRTFHVEFPNYNVLMDVLSTRTYEESGDYVVKDHRVSKEDRGDPNDPTFLIKLDGGVAYVQGHRYSSLKSNYVVADKARDYNSTPEEVISAPHRPSNYVLVYDNADTTNSSDPLNANGVFDFRTNELVYLHSQNKTQVGNHSLATANAWNSTLAGTGRVQSIEYDEIATAKARAAGRPGNSYRLYLYDIKPNKIHGHVGQPNEMKITKHWSDGTDTFYQVAPATEGRHAYHTSDIFWHGFSNTSPLSAASGDIVNLPVDDKTTGDAITVSGSTADGFSVRNALVKFANSTTIVTSGDHSGSVANSTLTSLRLLRATGGYSARRTIMLDANTAAQWSDSYLGATVRIKKGVGAPAEGERRVIIGYSGNSSVSTNLQVNNMGAAATNHLAFEGAVGRPRLAILNREFSAAPNTSTQYEISLGIHQARSAVSNVTASYTDANANALSFAVDPQTRWDIDTVSGIDRWRGNRGIRNGERISADDPINIRERGTTVFKGVGSPALVSLGHNLRAAQTYNIGQSTEWANTTFVVQREYDLTLSTSGVANFNTNEATGTPAYWRATTSSTPATTDDEAFLPVNGGGVLTEEEKRAHFTVVDAHTGHTINASSFKIDPDALNKRIELTVSGPGNDLGSSTYNTRNVKVLASVRVRNARPRQKTLHKANVTHFSHHKGNDSGHVVIRSKDSIYNETDGKLSPNTAGDTVSLGIADVYNVSVWTSGENGTALSNTTHLLDANYNITDWFDFDNGQRDNYYDHATLTLRGDAPGTPNGHIVAFVDYFTSDTLYEGFFSPDSYKTTTDIFHGTTSGTHYSAARQFQHMEKVTGNTSGVTAYVYDHLKVASSGDYNLRVVNMKPLEGNSFFQVGEGVYSANGDAWVVVKSTANADLEFGEIPSYTSPASGAKASLRNYLDFRPVRKTDDYAANSTLHQSFPLTSYNATWSRDYDVDTGSITEHNAPTNIVGTIQYFQGRIDSLVLTKDGKFELVKGTPSDNPRPISTSQDHDNGHMTLYHVKLPPYTTSVNKVSLKKIKNRRYTMKDIGKLEKRIANLEYYVSLSTLEKRTSDMTIVDGDGLERFKNGILVDTFEGSGVVDVYNTDTRYKYSIDPYRQKLFPYVSNEENKPFKALMDSSVGVTGHVQNSVITLSYTNTAFIQQGIATTPISVNPFSVKSYNGMVRLTPDFDRWIDRNKTPQTVDVDLKANWDGIEIPGPDETLAIGEWRGVLDPNGIVIEDLEANFNTPGTQNAPVMHRRDNGSYWYSTQDAQDEPQSYALDAGQLVGYQDTQLSMMSREAEATIEGAITTTSLAPYMRSRDIVIQAKGLKPNSRVYAFFDDQPVSRFISRANEIYIDPTTKSGTFTCENMRGGYSEPEEINIVDGSGNVRGEATLLAIRENDYGTVAVVVPTVNAASGKISDNGLTEGYYNTGSPSARFSATGTAQIKSKISSATATLYNQGQPGSGATTFKRNGHFFGKVSAVQATNDGHAGRGGYITLSQDATNYIANSFSYYPTGYANDTIDATGVVNIVSGPGQGQQITVKSYNASERKIYSSTMQTTAGALPTTDSWYHIVNTPSNKEPDTTSGSDFKGLPVPCGPVPFTNRHGEFFGVFHMPENKSFPYGKKVLTLTDRGDNNPLFTTSYAQGLYFATGTEETKTDVSLSTREFFPKVEQADRYEIANDPMSTDGLRSADPSVASTKAIFAMVTHIDILENSSSGWNEGSGKDRGDLTFGRVFDSHNGYQGLATTSAYPGVATEALNVSVGGRFYTPNFPGVYFEGGNISGVEGYCDVDNTGKISAIKITSGGACFVQEGEEIIPPEVVIPGDYYHSKGVGGKPGISHGDIRAVARWTTDPDIINEKLGAMATGDETITSVQAEAMASVQQGEFSDPLAQSFTVLSEGPTKDGVFITGVDLFFANKSSNEKLGVTVDIRPVINGQPSRYILPVGSGSYASKTLLPDEITAIDGSTIVPSLDHNSTHTSFIFDAPVYLAPGKQYAIVVSSNSTEYTLWRAHENENLVGTGVTTAAVPVGGSSNPVLATSAKSVGGTMFKSEQGSANFMPWIADPESDLMFRLQRAEFTTASGEEAAAVFRAGENLETGDTLIHEFRVNKKVNAPRKSSVFFKYRATDTDGNFGTLSALNRDGIHETLHSALELQVDGSTYVDHGSFELQSNFVSRNPYISPVIDTSQLSLTYRENQINNGALTQIPQIDSGGTGYDVGDTFTTEGGGGSGAVFTVAANTASGELTSRSLTLTSAGSGYHSTPTIVPQTVFNGSGANIIYPGETGATGGNATAKYITRRINLKEGFDATDLNVYLTAHKPVGTDVHVYYKVLSAEDSESFELKNWTRLIPSDSDRFDARIPRVKVEDLPMSEYEYTTGDSEFITYENSDGSMYDTFQSFAIKVVMFSDDPVKIPVIKDLRAIALS